MTNPKQKTNEWVEQCHWSTCGLYRCAQRSGRMRRPRRQRRRRRNQFPINQRISWLRKRILLPFVWVFAIISTSLRAGEHFINTTPLDCNSFIQLDGCRLNELSYSFELMIWMATGKPFKAVAVAVDWLHGPARPNNKDRLISSTERDVPHFSGFRSITFSHAPFYNENPHQRHPTFYGTTPLTILTQHETSWTF